MRAIIGMLLDEALPIHLWAEVARKTVYVQRTLHRLLEIKSHEEDFSLVKLEIRNLRVFGFKVYIHVPKEKRTNFDPSQRKDVFIGYSDTSKAYRIYFRGFENIEMSRYVTFVEHSTYFISRRTPI